VSDKILAMSKVLSKARKMRVAKPEGLAAPAAVAGYKVANSFTGLHSASSDISCLSLGLGSDIAILTGSSDNSVTLFDVEAGKVAGNMKGHTKKVKVVILHPTEGADTAVSCSDDSTIRIWRPSTGKEHHCIATHTAAVTGICLHPVSDYCLSVSEDRHWGFHSIETGKTLAYVTDAAIGAGYSCTQMHPDGKIFAAGTTDNMVHIWDIKNQKLMSSLPGHSGTVTSMAFSENGYYFATASEDGTVILWDLRKASLSEMAIQTITMGDDATVNSVAFDHSGNYLALGGKTVQVYNYVSKKWELVATLDSHKKPVQGVAFGPNATTLYSVGKDRAVKIYE
jgi:pre-mRNA-processing factor 19